MRDADLVQFLLDKRSPRGRRLILLASVWPKVGEGGGRDAKLKRWAALAGLPLTVVRVLGPVLLDNEICTAGGGVDDTASAVVAQVIVEGLEGPDRKSHGTKANDSNAPGDPGRS